MTIRKIHKNLYHGNREDAILASKSKVVDVIVYLGQDLPYELSHDSQIPIIHIPMKDGNNDDLKIHLVFLNIGYIELDDKVLVSCRAGISRSPTIITGFLATYYSGKYTFENALRKVKKLIPEFQPESNLLRKVEEVVKTYVKWEEKS